MLRTIAAKLRLVGDELVGVNYRRVVLVAIIAVEPRQNDVDVVLVRSEELRAAPRRKIDGLGGGDGTRRGGLRRSARQLGKESAAPTREAVALYVRNGLVALSRPIVLVGPCPLIIVTSSAKGRSLSLIDVNNCRGLPPGRSVRPIEPANTTSPTIARRCAGLTKTTLPGE
jgi:hypothetical protein